MGLISSFMLRLMNHQQNKMYNRFLNQIKDPKQAQLKSLEIILKRTENSEIKKSLGINSILTYEDFYKKCPSTDYTHYKAITKSMYQDNNRPYRMGRKACDYFVITSGTTSEPKYIPLQNDYREEYMRIFLAWLGCLKKQRPQTFMGKALYLADVTLLETSPTSRPCGVMSGYNFRKIPSFIRKALYSSHEDFYKLKEIHQKNITLLAHAMNSELTLLGTIMPETLVMFLDHFFKYSDEVISYLQTGLPTFEYPKELEKSLKLRPHQSVIERAKRLQAKGKMDNLYDFFPQLKTIICWKSSTAEQYLDRIKHYIPHDVVVWDGIYSASEGWFNFPDDPNKVGGPVAINGHFLEFKEANKEQAPFLGAWELEDGKYYEIFVTSSMGFFRYQMKDKVQVQGFTSNTPRIVFIEKVGEWLDHAMERITPTHVQTVMDLVLEKLKLERNKIIYYTMCPCKKQGQIHYTLIIETSYPQSVFDEVNFNQILCQVNPNYGRNMTGKLLDPLKVAIVKPGFIKNELLEREREGKSVAQFKYSAIDKSTQMSLKVCPCDGKISRH